jgi:hypothetical protein
MSVRVFTCSACDHALRLGATKCGSCGASTPLVNRTATHLIMASVVIIVAFVALTLIPAPH